MSFRQFAIGLTLTFGLAWAAIVIVPFFLMRNPAPVSFNEAVDNKTGFYFPKTTGRVVNGAQIYAENGCYYCHTQVIRPSYAGNDLGRPDWGGLAKDEERGDTRRESNVFDYRNERFAQIGQNRLGPDLSILGRRVEAIYAKGGDPRAWLYAHLYNPRLNPQLTTSLCPPLPFLFEERKVLGQTPADALPLAKAKEGYVIVPTDEAKMLVDYLLSLKRDDALPAAINPAPPQKAGADKKKG